MNTQVLHDTLAASMRGEIQFPEVVRVLMSEGVESYRADLVRHEETFYMPSGETHVTKMDFTPVPIADDFAAADVLAAIRTSQAGAQTYKQFLDRAMAAGTTHYTVFLAGRKCIYFGRKGEFHVEEFPTARS
jgi:uncharacterized protein YbcV (DUF1398 family)